MTLSEHKSALRSKVKKWRSELDSQVYQQKCECLRNRLFEMDIVRSARTIHCYVSMNKRREVDTRAMIEHWLNLGKEVVVPLMKSQGKLDHYYIEDLNELSTNDWGVSEPNPVHHTPAQVEDLDLVIVPMAAADQHCNRLGYGKGYYDRFLSSLSAPKVGLCYDHWVIDEVPVASYDVPMDLIITENALYDCNE
jgi:5-formyltetrahydrofolate cyclo-ligase